MHLDKSKFPDCAFPAITAVLSTYNRARYIERSIESILNQTLPPNQVIVVDDGSTDATPRVLERFQGRIEVLRKPNGGKAMALNLALTRATGDAIWICDDDDIALPHALEALSTALVQHPECGFSYGSYDHIVEQEDGELVVIDPKLCIDRWLDFKTSVLERCYIFQPALLVRRRCYDAVGPFNESLVRSQDYEMLLRLTRRYKGVYADSILFHQRQHRGLRGTAAVPVTQSDNGWIKYDRQIFTRIYSEYPLSEYLPGSEEDDRALSIAERRLAGLERCCIMVRKGLWELASGDMRAFAALLRSEGSPSLTKAESAIFTRFLGPYSYADHTLDQAGVFVGALNDLWPIRVRLHAVGLLLQPWTAMGRSLRISTSACSWELRGNACRFCGCSYMNHIEPRVRSPR